MAAEAEQPAGRQGEPAGEQDVPAGRRDEPAGQQGEPAGGQSRPVRRQDQRTVRGMVPAMAVVLLAAFVIYLFIPHDESADPVKTVGYQVELDSARRAAPYPVLAPEGLSAKWRATSVRYEGGGPDGRAWHLGFMTPDTQYAAVEQSDARSPGKFIDEVTQGARKTSETVRVRGSEWTRYEGEKYDALVKRSETKAAADGGEATGARPYTTVVTGTATFGQLKEMAAALSPDAKGRGKGAGGGSGSGGSGQG